MRLGWLIEGAGVLAWALGRVELPPLERFFEPRVVLRQLFYMNDEGRGVLETPSIRSLDEILRFRETAFAIHCRLTEWSLRPNRIDFVETADRCAFLDEEVVRELPLVHGDLAIDGVEIASCNELVRDHAFSIAYERHRAAIWLAGHEDGYATFAVNT